MFRVFIVAEHGEVLTDKGCASAYAAVFENKQNEEVEFVMGTMYNYINTFRWKIKEAYAICVVTYDGEYTTYEVIEKEEIPDLRLFSKAYKHSGETSYQVCKRYLDMKKQMKQG